MHAPTYSLFYPLLGVALKGVTTATVTTTATATTTMTATASNTMTATASKCCMLQPRLCLVCCVQADSIPTIMDTLMPLLAARQGSAAHVAVAATNKPAASGPKLRFTRPIPLRGEEAEVGGLHEACLVH